MIRFGATLVDGVLTIWLVSQEAEGRPFKRIPAELRLEDLWPGLPEEFRAELVERGAVPDTAAPAPAPIPGQLTIEDQEAAA